jgi:methyl-accepting chemotaxis protein
MINRLQQGANIAVQVMNSGRDQARETVKQAGMAGESLNVITSAVDHIDNMNEQIATAVEEQSRVADEINRNIINISDIAEETSNGASSSSETSNAVSRHAEHLDRLVEQFTVQ